MEVYRIKKWGDRPETYVKKSWCTTIDKQGRLSFFVYGKGYRKTKAFELINAPIDENKKDGLYVGEIATKYGHDIATEVCENAFGCCKISAQHWVGMFKIAYQTAIENLTETEISQVSRDVVNLFRPFSIFPVLEIDFLDRELAKLDPEYNNAKCTYKGKENVSMKAYITEKYGKATMKLIEKMLE
jgi:hypothetical protein